MNIYLLGSIYGFFGVIQFSIQHQNKISLPTLYINNIFNIKTFFILMLIIKFIHYKIISTLRPLHSEMIYYISLTIIISKSI